MIHSLNVGGTEFGMIAATNMHEKALGIILISDPQVFGKEHFDFDPRAQTIQVLANYGMALEVDLPEAKRPASINLRHSVELRSKLCR